MLPTAATLRDGYRSARRAEYSVILVVVVAVLGFTIAAVLIGLDEVLARLERINPSFLLAALPLLVWGLGFRILRWTVMCSALGVPTPPGRTILYYVAGLTLALTPARLGETVRLWIIHRCHGYPYARLGPLYIGDRLGDAVSYLFLAVVSLVAYLDHAPFVVVCAAVILLAIALLMRPAPLRALIGFGYRMVGALPRVFAAFRSILTKSAALLAPRTAFVIVALGMIAGLGPTAIFYVAAHEVGIELSYLQALFIVSLGVLAGGLTMLPGGVGGAEPTMFALLMLGNASADAALAVVIVQRLFVLWIPAVIGFGALGMAMRLAADSTSGQTAACESSSETHAIASAQGRTL